MAKTKARSARALQPLARAWLTCMWFASAWLFAGCNSLLDIREPSDQLLEAADSGTPERRDSGRPHDVAQPPSDDARIPSDPDDDGDDDDTPPVVTRDGGYGPPPVVDAGAPEDSIYLWANWPMPNPVASSLPNAHKYSTPAVGRVEDTVTHLQWEQYPQDQLLTWSAAVEYCNNLMVGEVGGWRLPARIELLSLLDFSQASPAIDPQTFMNAPPDFFWSSSTFIGAPETAWGVNFGFKNGLVATYEMKEPHRVRCVR